MEPESDDLPEFFNVYITQLSSNKMLIPRGFVDYMGRRKSGLAELVAGPSGETWRVELVDDGEDLYFTDGWQDFVKDNLIRDGDFMFFKYHGNLMFSVVIYDESMCEKQMWKSSRARDGVLESKKSPSVRASRREADPPVPSVAKTSKRTSLPVKPFFEKRITGSNANLNFPSSFVHEHSLSYKSYEKMVLRTSENSSWEVNIINNRGIIVLSGGWPAFVRDNCVNAGDTCKLELLDRLEMMVHVTRTRKKGSGKKRKMQ